MPNAFAHVVLFSYPLIVLMFFSMMRVHQAIAVTLIAGYLLLPRLVGIDLPVLPRFDKNLVPTVMAGICAAVVMSRNFKAVNSKALGRGQARVAPIVALPGWIPRDKWVLMLTVGLILSTVMTGMTNGNGINIGGFRFLKGYTLYDTGSAVLGVLVMLLPFLLARRFFAHPENQKTLLGIFALAGTCHACLAVIEIVLSPQLNQWIYGFFPHQFIQHIRGGGYRPVAFMHHGLWFAIFQTMSVLAALGAYRANAPMFPRQVWLFMAIWIWLVMGASNSLGALVLVTLAAPLVLFTPTRLQVLVSAFICGTVLFYPALRESPFLPLNSIVSAASVIDTQRANSLQFRLDNEELLLDHARSKPLFGWGTFGRNRVYDENTGNDIATTDGAWIIAITVRGWAGYLAMYGLMTISVFRYAIRRKSMAVGPEGAALSMMLAVNLVDTILNGTITVITWLVVGAMLGSLELGAKNADDPEADQVLDGPARGGRARHRGARGTFATAGAHHISQARAAETAETPAESSDPSGAPEGPELVPATPTIGERHTRFAQTHSRALASGPTGRRPRQPQKKQR